MFSWQFAHWNWIHLVICVMPATVLIASSGASLRKVLSMSVAIGIISATIEDVRLAGLSATTYCVFSDWALRAILIERRRLRTKALIGVVLALVVLKVTADAVSGHPTMALAWGGITSTTSHAVGVLIGVALPFGSLCTGRMGHANLRRNASMTEPQDR